MTNTTWTPAHQVSSGQTDSRFQAVTLDENDTQATAVSKILVARADPHASEAASVAQLGADLQGDAKNIEADSSLSPEGRKARIAPAIERTRAKLAKVRETIAHAESYAAELEGHSQDFTDGESEADRIFARNQHAAEAAQSKEAKLAKGRAFMAACNTPFEKLTRAQGNLIRACLDAADLGVDIIEPLHLNAGYQALQETHPDRANVAGLRARANALRSVVNGVESSVAKLSKAYGLDPEAIG